MTEEVTQKDRFRFFKGFIGAFRLMHILPVMTVTTIALFVAILSLKGSATFSVFFTNLKDDPITILWLVFFILTVFFQEGFLGIQNDYIDRDIDQKYNKSKTIPDGWVSPDFAYWWMIACYILFTGFSVVTCIWSVTGFWGILFVQGATATGLFYNIVAKHKPFSIAPYFLGFPLIPTYVWITFGGFEPIYGWALGLLILVAFPAHIANELPDYEKDVEHGKRNFAVFLGEKASTIVYWVAILLIEILITIVFIINFASLNWIVYLVTILSSLATAGFAIFLLWKRKWKTDTLVFNVVTACIGLQTIGFFILIGL